MKNTAYLKEINKLIEEVKKINIDYSKDNFLTIAFFEEMMEELKKKKKKLESEIQKET
tara:strand:- start:95 stop:268 length:174 start_codon:yes stop_codon:yes gene_type:complete